VSSARVWLVEMINHTDRQDDEVWRVRARSAAAAKIVADDSATSRFAAGRIVPARGGTKSQKELAREFRSYCVRSL
jgi:hypothetical protein